MGSEVLSRRRRVFVVSFMAVGLIARTGGFAADEQRPPATPKLRQARQPSGPVATAPLARYGCIWDGRLSRSGMPKQNAEAGWRWLRAQGVVSVVNFRQDNDGDYARLGFKYSLWLPLKGSNPPTDAAAESFLGFITDPAHWPVHIHCAEGKTRTGLMAALARYAVDGWSVEKALEEARLYRKGGLTENQVQWLREWAAKHEPGSHRIAPRGLR